MAATQLLAERWRSSSLARHPEERSCARWLLTELDRAVPVITRPRNGCTWGALGSALRVCEKRAGDSACPAVLNDTGDCFDLNGAFPAFVALGARALQPGLVNRIAFEFRTEPTARRHIAQVGVARVGDVEAGLKRKLDEDSSLLGSVLYTSTGDVQSSVGAMEVVAAGREGTSLTQRLGGDWCSGARPWLQSATAASRILLEVDLREGFLSLRLDEWTEDAVVVRVPGLASSEEDERPWFPFAALTAMGQEVKMLDFHVRAEV